MPQTDSFRKLYKKVKKEYFGEPVPEKYQKEYGTKYGKKDVMSVAIRIAKSKGILIDKPEVKKKGLYFK